MAKAEAGARLASYIAKAVKTMETADPRAGRFISALSVGQPSSMRRAWDPEVRTVRDLYDYADNSGLVGGMSEFRGMLQSLAKSQAKTTDDIGPLSSIANELYRARALPVARLPEDVAAAKKVAGRARALPLFDAQPEAVKDILVRSSSQTLTPGSFLTARDISRQPEDVQEIALALIADGVPMSEALKMARLI
jgi:hypothetical protein